MGGVMSEARPSVQPGMEAAAEGAEETEVRLEDDGEEGLRGRRRSRTMSRKETARDLRRKRALGVADPELQQTIEEIERARPRSRAECAQGPRPCMFVSCKHHLYLDVNPATGSIKLNFP